MMLAASMDEHGTSAVDRLGWLWATASLIPVALFQRFVFFSDPEHFFQGDSVYWLYHRHRSWSSFFRAFLSLDDSGWYRPLANRILESLLYSFYGLNPAPYHWALLPILLLNVLAVYVLSWMLTRRRLAALLAAIFFGTHPVNAYVSYDVSFTPELLYTLFFLASVIAYLKYLRTRHAVALALSVAFCAATLCSKEAGVTLPAVLLVIHITETGSLFRTKALRFLKWHFALLFLYLSLVVAYLHVGGIGNRSFFERPEDPAEIGYLVVFDRGIFQSAGAALSEAFLSGTQAGWINGVSWLPRSLRIVQLGIALFFVRALFSGRRRIVLAGMAWFFLSLFPMLTLANHWLPYYAFLPMAGLAIAIGQAFDLGYEHLARLSKPAALSITGGMFGILVLAGAVGGANERIGSGLLGGSSRAALSAVAAVRAAHPRPAAGTTLYFLDGEQPQLPWYDGQGGLFRMAFHDDTIEVLHASEGKFLRLDQVEDDCCLVFRFRAGTFQEVSLPERVSETLARQDEAGHQVSIVPARVTAGRGAYTVRVTGLGGGDIQIYYRVENGPMQSFGARLRDDGSVTFDVGSETPKGTYHFLAIEPAASKWFRIDKSLVID